METKAYILIVTFFLNWRSN